MCPASRVLCVPGEALLSEGNARQRQGLEGKYPKAARKSLVIFDGGFSSCFWTGAAGGKNIKYNPVPSQGKEGNKSNRGNFLKQMSPDASQLKWKG